MTRYFIKILLALVANSINAADKLIIDGKLIGANNIDINGTVYNVRFLMDLALTCLRDAIP